MSVIVPVFNAQEHLEASLDSVVRAADAYGNTEIILLDNGSTDGSWEVLRSKYAACARVEQKTSVPVSALRNHGARLATGEILSFIDADCLVPVEYFHRAVEVLKSVNTDATGSTYELPHDPHWIEETWHHLHRRPKNRYTMWINAGNFLIRKEAFDRIGGFNEDLITAEDVELCERLRSSGSKVWEAEEVVAVHLGNPKSLGRFYKKQVWQALGVFDSTDKWLSNKPIAMTLVHLACCVGGCLFLVVPAPIGPIGRLAGFLGLSTLAPAATVAYRAISNRRLYRPIRSTLLYYVYFTGRVHALGAVVRERLRTGGNVEGQAYY